MRGLVLLPIVSIVGLLAAAPAASAFEVEPGSLGNRLYVVVANEDATGALEGLAVDVPEAFFTSAPTAVSLPGSVPASGVALAGFEFSVTPDAPLGAPAVMTVAVAGSVNGSPRHATGIFVLVVSEDAGPQPPVGAGVPGFATLDTDGDGVPDQVEIADGSDPFFADEELAGAIPAMSAGLMAVLGLLLLGAYAAVVPRAERRR